MIKKHNLIITFIIFLFSIISCNSNSGSNNQIEDSKKLSPITNLKLSKVIFYLENSESMFGYLNGATEYIKVIAELSNKADFVTNNITRDLYLINGAAPKMSINFLGNNPQNLTNVLNLKGFNSGDITKSDLNSMFQLALSKASKDTISILVSDAIYDIQVDPITAAGALEIKGKGTFENFVKRLNDTISNTQTLLIKMNSKFNGKYFYTTQNGSININQSRPYYIWIFGEDELVSKYFSEEYIKTLDGYENYARFSENSYNNINYDVLPSENRIGTFKPKNQNRYILESAKTDTHGKGFQFTIGVDYNNLLFSDNFLTSTNNYVCSNPNYSIKEIKKNNKSIPGFTGSHLITVFTDKNHIGTVEIKLMNKIPNWISETNVNDETKIDSIRTYGFQFLTKGITDAYNTIKKDDYLATFKIQITK